MMSMHNLARQDPVTQVSVICTVYNERHNIERLLDSLAKQNRRPDEVVICDGDSRDGTAEWLRAYVEQRADDLPPVKLLLAAGANISRGRNLAIEAATGPIIAVTDAGVRLSEEWLVQLVAPWAGPISENVQAVAGFFLPDPANRFESALGATVLPLPDDIVPEHFLPSSRSVAFLKSTWAAAGGYPEWLDYCEDLIFDMRVNALAPYQPSGFAWAPDALVYFRPRSSLVAFWIQYYRYARGDGKADLWRRRHLLRYAVYGFLLPALVGHALWGSFAKNAGWIGLIVGVVAYCWRPWQRLARLYKGQPLWRWLSAAAYVPLIRATGDLAKMCGYPVGLLWRWRNMHRPEVEWRRYLGERHGNGD
jgi:glycosyltransferase involved in cell wall biosynthesis